MLMTVLSVVNRGSLQNSGLFEISNFATQ